MKGGSVLLVMLFLLSVGCAENETTVDSLTFVDMDNQPYYITIAHGDDAYRFCCSAFHISFGNSRPNGIYVSTNGYFSMGTAPPESFLNNFPYNSSSYSIVAPFAADITTRSNGSVRYFARSGSSGVERDYIESVLGVTFRPTWKLVAEWYNVAWLYGKPQKTNRFQGILITDGVDSYALFVYNCNEMDWSGNAVIGWQASTSYYRTHPLSASDNAKNIACLNTGSNYNTVLFKIGGASDCPSYKVGCFDGDCTLSPRCDGSPGCSDGSDEVACSSATCKYPDFTCDNHKCVSDSSQCDDSSGSTDTGITGLAVGVSVGLTMLLMSVTV